MQQQDSQKTPEGMAQNGNLTSALKQRRKPLPKAPPLGALGD